VHDNLDMLVGGLADGMLGGPVPLALSCKPGEPAVTCTQLDQCISWDCPPEGHSKFDCVNEFNCQDFSCAFRPFECGTIFDCLTGWGGSC
jgi:hypothetical protein